MDKRISVIYDLGQIARMEYDTNYEYLLEVRIALDNRNHKRD